MEWEALYSKALSVDFCLFVCFSDEGKWVEWLLLRTGWDV